MPTSFDLKEAFFGDMLRGEGAKCVTLICKFTMQCYLSMFKGNVGYILCFTCLLSKYHFKYELYYQIKHDQSIVNDQTLIQELLAIMFTFLPMLTNYFPSGH